jgi:hypothetical protein
MLSIQASDFVLQLDVEARHTLIVDSSGDLMLGIVNPR